MDVSATAWWVTIGVLVVFLALDVGVIARRPHVPTMKECAIALCFYVGAALLESDGGYVGRVLAEQGFLRSVADGRGVPVNVSNVVPAARDVQAQPAERPASSEPAAADAQVALAR